MLTGHPLLVVARAPARIPCGVLQDRGWQPTLVPDLAAAAAVLRSRPFEVGLLWKDSSDPQDAGHFEDCVLAAEACLWVGVFQAADSARPPWRDHILAHFFDHHALPADPDALAQSLAHAAGRAALRAQQLAELAEASDLGMVGRSPGLARLRREIRKGGPTGAPVLVCGESGTGKELVARALHDCSHRRGPFVAVNCGALPPTLIHSELFGHERGSFSGAVSARRGLIESAHGGTLFLDEVPELPLASQAMLLRFLQEGRFLRVGSGTETEVDVRVIAASHVDLAAAVAAGTFRNDLFYRINVLALYVPPLRERREDIPLLARYEHARCAAGRPHAPRGFHSDALAAMLAHSWPGNVRELINRVQRAVVMGEQALIRASDLGLCPAPAPGSEDLRVARLEAEKIAIRHSLERSGCNLSQAARDLGVSRMTLYRLLEKHRLACPAEWPVAAARK